MRVNRRRLLAGVIGAGAIGSAAVPQCKSELVAPPGASTGLADLDRAAARPVLRLDELKSPVVIESIKLLKKDKEYIVHVRSRDGLQGIALTIPVACGEQEFSHWRFRWMIANRGADIVQPDLHYYGGMIRSIRVARMAQVANMPVALHISGGFGFVYMLHFASCVPNLGRYQEYKLGTNEYNRWFDPPIRIKEGRMSIPTGPGAGIKDVAGILKGAREV